MTPAELKLFKRTFEMMKPGSYVVTARQGLKMLDAIERLQDINRDLQAKLSARAPGGLGI